VRPPGLQGPSCGNTAGKINILNIYIYILKKIIPRFLNKLAKTKDNSINNSDFLS